MGSIFSTSSPPTRLQHAITGTVACESNKKMAAAEITCTCDHCLEQLQKKSAAPVSPPSTTKAAPAPVPVPPTTTTSPSTAPKKEGPSFEEAAKLLGVVPHAGYSRFPFLEQYAERALQIKREFIQRIRIEDLKLIFQRRHLIVPPLFLHAEKDYVGPRIVTLPSSASPPSAASGSGSGSVSVSGGISKEQLDQCLQQFTSVIEAKLAAITSKAPHLPDEQDEEGPDPEGPLGDEEEEEEEGKAEEDRRPRAKKQKQKDRRRKKHDHRRHPPTEEEDQDDPRSDHLKEAERPRRQEGRGQRERRL